MLVEATGRILPEPDDRLGQWTLRALRRRGVGLGHHQGVAQVYRIRLTGFGFPGRSHHDPFHRK